MYDSSLLILQVINFILVCALPFVFFRRDGQFNLPWLMTAWPFVIFPFVLVSGYYGALQPWFDTARWLVIPATLAHAFSIGLIAMIIGTHRVPLALWHQNNDAPVSIVTWGPYAYVRHPFYSAFLLCQLSAFFVFPHIATLGITLYSICILFFTARREEKRLSDSEFGEEYQTYMQKTGRFWPVFK